MTIIIQVKHTANDGTEISSNLLHVDSSALEDDEIDLNLQALEMCRDIATATGEYEGKMGAAKCLIAKNIKGNVVTFRLGQDIIHETGDGQHFPGKIAAFQPGDRIEILFPNGTKSTRHPSTCFHG